MTHPTAELARFAAALNYDDLPSDVVQKAKIGFLNFAACAIGGADEDVVVRARRAFAPFRGAGDLSIVGTDQVADPITAAFINCFASAVLAFDDTFAHTIVHPIGPVAAAILAAGEAQAMSGKDLLTALVVGTELVCRASMAVSAEPASGGIGWSQTGICSGLGVAAAVAKLFGLGADEIARAVAFGASTGSGLRAMNGTASATLAASHAAANGYRGAVMAQAGVDGPGDVLESPYGFVSLFSDMGAIEHLTAELGSRFMLMETHFKPYPCGVVAHAPIDAALEVRDSSKRSWKEISSVLVRVPTSGIALGDRPRSKSAGEASVSIQHWVAAAFVGGSMGAECLKQDWVDSPTKRCIEERITLEGDSAMGRSSASVRVTFNDGEQLTATVLHALGTEHCPMADEDIEAKFRTAAAGKFPGAEIEDLLRRFRSFEDLEDVGMLMRSLRAAREGF